MNRAPKRPRLSTPWDYTAWILAWALIGWLAQMLLKP
jgi:hypothetical protein